MLDVRRRNNVRLSGTGDPQIVFAHGYGCDQTMWLDVEPAFASTCRTILFDHVGAGRSDLSAFSRVRYATLMGYARDLIEIVESVATSPVIYVGHSVSAMIGVLAAIERPQLFAQLVLLTPSPCYKNDGDYQGGFDPEDLEQIVDSMDANYLGWSRSLAPVIMGNPDRPELAEKLTNSFCRTDPEIARHFGRVTFLSDHRADLHRSRVPSVILQCQIDPIAPPSVGRYMHGAMPSSQLIELQATGHCPHVSHPNLVIAAIQQAMAAHSA
jgi:sigma-B regulation protein RsbQ